VLFDQLIFIDDPEPYSGAMNMAVDETLLTQAEAPTLRIYRWSEPTVSFGYFGKIATVREAYPTHVPVRRWTGGGIVPHGQDLTYTFAIPSSSFKASPLESYRLIHEHIVALLQKHGLNATFTAASDIRQGDQCFINPATHDIMLDETKIAGAAQRRTRKGLLHQGSIQLTLPAQFSTDMAVAFSKEIHTRTLTPETLETATRLAAEKYATDAWLQKY